MYEPLVAGLAVRREPPRTRTPGDALGGSPPWALAVDRSSVMIHATSSARSRPVDDLRTRGGTRGGGGGGGGGGPGVGIRYRLQDGACHGVREVRGIRSTQLLETGPRSVRIVVRDVGGRTRFSPKPLTRFVPNHAIAAVPELDCRPALASSRWDEIFLPLSIHLCRSAWISASAERPAEARSAEP